VARRQHRLDLSLEKNFRLCQRQFLAIDGNRALTRCQDVAAPVRLGSIRQGNEHTDGASCDVHRRPIGDSRAASDVVYEAETRLAPLDRADHAGIDHAHERSQQREQSLASCLGAQPLGQVERRATNDHHRHE
jgi:hypothetical protein